LLDKYHSTAIRAASVAVHAYLCNWPINAAEPLEKSTLLRAEYRAHDRFREPRARITMNVIAIVDESRDKAIPSICYSA